VAILEVTGELRKRVFNEKGEEIDTQVNDSKNSVDCLSY